MNYSGKVEEYKHYIDEYKNILKDINYFYEIEKQFIDNLNKKENESSPKPGYLIKLKTLNQLNLILLDSYFVK